MRIPNPIPPEGVYVVLNAAFTGVKAFSWMSLAKNNAFPKFQLFEDYIVTRVMFSRRREISDVESVDVSKTMFNSWQITVVFKNSPFTFIAMPQDETDVFDTVLFFKRKGVLLSVAAQNFYNERSGD